MPETSTMRVKVASVSLNQTVYDYATNVTNIEKAIDLATADRADILSTEELSLTGYPADDYHQWNKNNASVWQYLNIIARYAEEKDPNLVVTVGAPWHYADKSLPADDSAYNINNRPFNTHFIITGGRVVAVSAKSILADGPAEYEPRQFNNWPLSKGTIDIVLPDGSTVPFGKPIVFLRHGPGAISLTNEICAEAWPGVHNDLSINQREMNEARHIAVLAKDHDLSIVMNPSASRPEPAINKEKIRGESLCKTGSHYCGLYVYTNYLGSGSGTYAAEGSRLFAQNGEITHHGQRYSFGDVSYSSLVADVPLAQRGHPSATAAHDFRDHQALGKKGNEASFDKAFADGRITAAQLSYEEYMRSISLWLRDYLAKPAHSPQGYVISLSGGKDSAYGAIAVASMIDLDVQENGIEGFLDRFKKLKCKDEVLKINSEQGEKAALAALKKSLLTCVYLPTDNSSERTLKAARFLVEGGTLPDGTKVEGIGGKFYVAPVQGLFDEATVAFTGLDLSKIARENTNEILSNTYKNSLDADERTALARAKLMHTIRDYVNATPGNIPALPGYITRNCVNPLPSWGNPADDLTLQNIQARVRLPIPWTIGNQEGKMPLVTSNESEAVHSYTTAGGDMSMGGANPIGGVSKPVIIKSLAYIEKHGLNGLGPLRSLYWVNHEKPTAELRKVVKGTAEQTDEGDLGFTYEQSEFIEKRLLEGRQTPLEVLPQMRADPLFPQDLFNLGGILINLTRRWESGQFKRIMSTLAPHVGSNVDPHQAVRTTVLGDHFRTPCAHMMIEIVAELTGGPEAFHKKFGIKVDEAKTASGMNAEFRTALITATKDKLMDPAYWQRFEPANRNILSYTGPMARAGMRQAARRLTGPSAEPTV